MNIDLKGSFLCAQAVAKHMIQQKSGNIISMSSRGALKPTLNSGAYSIAKQGVIMLTRMLAIELAPYNIRVNAIAPGGVLTKFNEEMRKDPVAFQSTISRIPLGRWAEPQDMIGTALFLASDASAYITGHTIVVVGGQSA
jgi:2-deoxy-D-gluconate 3-dehydrogenase